MSETRTYLQELLARGATETQAAQLAGCTVGYVSQLLAEPEFKLQVDALRAARMQDHVQREEKAHKIHGMYMDLEERILQDLQHNVGMLRAGEKARLLGVLASKKPPQMPAAPSNAGDAAAARVININIPHIAAAQFVLDKNMDIIGLQQEGKKEQELLPLPTNELKKLREARNSARAQVTDGNAIAELFNLDESEERAA